MLKFLLSKKLVFIALSFDLSSSAGLQERNAVLGRGTFGIRQASLSTGITLGSLILMQHYEKAGRAQKISLGILSGVHIAAGASNLYQRVK